LQILPHQRLSTDIEHQRHSRVKISANSGQTRARLACPLCADIVAKVSNRGATIFPPEDKTAVIAD
jgi:hypothetical protein